MVQSTATTAGNFILQATCIWYVQRGAEGSHLSEATMGLAGQAGDAPPGDHTLCSTTSCNGNGVNHLILLQHSIDRDGLLEVLVGKVHLLRHVGTAIHLHTKAGVQHFHTATTESCSLLLSEEPS